MTGLAETRVGRVEYLERGAGPVVLTVHGAMGGCDQSDLLGRVVCEPEFRFIGVSRPGYLGTALSVGRSADEQAESHAALLDVLGIDRAAVVAVSGGGPSAIQFALRHADRCRGLVLISTCAGPTESKIPLSFRLMQVLMRSQAMADRARAKVENNLEASLRRSVSDPALLARVMADDEALPLLKELTLGMFEGMPRRLAGTRNDIQVSRETKYALEEVTVPTLVVHGTRDPLLPFDRHGRQLAARIPGAQLLALEGGEHAAIFTHRNLVRQRVTEFLRGLK